MKISNKMVTFIGIIEYFDIHPHFITIYLISYLKTDIILIFNVQKIKTIRLKTYGKSIKIIRNKRHQ